MINSDFCNATNQNLPPAPVQPSPAPVSSRAGRRAGARIRRTGPLRTGRLTDRTAIPFHANHQIPAFIHAQQYLSHLPRSAGVFDRHPATGAGIRHSPRPAALRCEHGHAHAVIPLAIASHPGIQRHTFIKHISIAFHRRADPDRRGVY